MSYQPLDLFLSQCLFGRPLLFLGAAMHKLNLPAKLVTISAFFGRTVRECILPLEFFIFSGVGNIFSVISLKLFSRSVFSVVFFSFFLLVRSAVVSIFFLFFVGALACRQ